MGPARKILNPSWSTFCAFPVTRLSKKNQIDMSPWRKCKCNLCGHSFDSTLRFAMSNTTRSPAYRAKHATVRKSCIKETCMWKHGQLLNRHAAPIAFSTASYYYISCIQEQWISLHALTIKMNIDYFLRNHEHLTTGLNTLATVVVALANHATRSKNPHQIPWNSWPCMHTRSYVDPFNS
jgi:hypothetical protein